MDEFETYTVTGDTLKGISITETLQWVCEMVTRGEIEEGSFVIPFDGIDLEITVRKDNE